MQTVKDMYMVTKYDIVGICPYCGTELCSTYNKNFCGKCGKRIKWNGKGKFEFL